MTDTQSHIVTITGYSSNGDGVARLDDGRVVFVQRAARGDVLDIFLTKESRGSAKAGIVGIRSPSPYRIEPDCPEYPQCGGCDFRHVTYEEELDAKLWRVDDALARIGGLPVRASGILSTGDVDHYRNKATLHYGGKSWGFYRSGSREIIPVESCLLLKSDLNKELGKLTRNETASNTVTDSALSRLAPKGATSRNATSYATKKPKATPAHLAENHVTLHSGQTHPGGTITEEIDGLIFTVEGFFQVNTAAALLLFQKAREFASMTKDENLLDLYCGVGALTLFVGRDAGYALGVEQNQAAVDAARENAKRNGLPHIEFICADVAAWEADAPHPDCIIVDPPRKGLSRGAVQKIVGLSPSRVVYISCDPATLARDLRLLDGYSVREVCAVDMFPRTANVECCCLLQK